jgi:nicotinate-nucleotide--dimethylbenzimidazole phosphoribosyltransferase
MRLGEGSGAVTALPVLRTAQALLAEMGTLADLGVAGGAEAGARDAGP